MYSDFDVDANGQIIADGLTAGKWSGTFNFNINLNSAEVEELDLPKLGTPLSEMSFKQIQLIAQNNLTSDYDIKVNDIIKINDEIDAEIVEIGDDYIECFTVQEIISSDSPQTKSTLKDGQSVTSYGPAAYYQYPQVNYNDRSNSEQISYVYSDIKKNVELWLELQSDEFKSVLKDTEHTYEVATLTFDGSKYSATITNTTTDTEKIYIPTADKLKNIYSVSINHKSDSFWTATSYAFSSGTYAVYSFGSFRNGYRGYVSNNSGNSYSGSCALFRIG